MMDKIKDQHLIQTPSQTVGPYFAYGLTAEQYEYPFTSINSGNLIDETIEGERIILRGRIFDAEENLIPDAMIEIWHADSNGNYSIDPSIPQKLFGRQGTGTLQSCEYIFHTIKPGSVDGQAPHINVILFMRGQLSHAYTRIYFEDLGSLNNHDPVLLSVPPERRATLIATPITNTNPINYQFDIHMQGLNETVFFDV